MAKRLFKTGRTVMTRGVFDAACADEKFTEFCCMSLARHVSGDWGNVCVEDYKANTEAVTIGERILSAYDYPANPEFNIWIITEYDRSATTILFPREY